MAPYQVTGPVVMVSIFGSLSVGSAVATAIIYCRSALQSPVREMVTEEIFLFKIGLYVVDIVFALGVLMLLIYGVMFFICAFVWWRDDI